MLTKECRLKYIVSVFIVGNAVHAYFLKYLKQGKQENVGGKMKI